MSREVLVLGISWGVPRAPGDQGFPWFWVSWGCRRSHVVLCFFWCLGCPERPRPLVTTHYAVWHHGTNHYAELHLKFDRFGRITKPNGQILLESSQVLPLCFSPHLTPEQGLTVAGSRFAIKSYAFVEINPDR